MPISGGEEYVMMWGILMGCLDLWGISQDTPIK